MKLLKKILPITSVVALITPIATSCNNENVIDGTKLFVPSASQAVADAEHVETGYSDEDATQLYITNTKNNVEVFTQDIKAIISSLLHWDVMRSILAKQTLPKYNVELNYSNFVIDNTKGAETMSFETNGSIYIENSLEFGFSSAKLSNFKIEVNQMPYFMYYNWTSLNWMLLSEYVDNDFAINSNASITATVSGTIFEILKPGTWHKYNNETIIIDKNHNVNDLDNKWESIYKIFIPVITCVIDYMDSTFPIAGGSYHMINITPNELNKREGIYEII